MTTPQPDSQPAAAAVTPPPRLLAIAPYLMVRDLHVSAAFYRERLGFIADRLWGDPPNFCMARRDGLTLMLAQADDPLKVRPNSVDGAAWDAYVWVSDVEALFAEVKAKGARVLYEPSVTFYGMKEFAVADPDGYVIAFGQPRAAADAAAAAALAT